MVFSNRVRKWLRLRGVNRKKLSVQLEVSLSSRAKDRSSRLNARQCLRGIFVHWLSVVLDNDADKRTLSNQGSIDPETDSAIPRWLLEGRRTSFALGSSVFSKMGPSLLQIVGGKLS
jgi:hypothetical protein